jgi:hypothetical protein
VIGAAEAVMAVGRHADRALVAGFLDIPEPRAEAALNLAVDLGLLSVHAAEFTVASPLVRFLATPNDQRKAVVLRVVLESYDIFVTFRERLLATASVDVAAQQVKALYDLQDHREEIKDTLISLGTFSHALIAEGGGRYRLGDRPFDDLLVTLAQACADVAAAEQSIRDQLGPETTTTISRIDVLAPLADALIRARDGDARGAVVAAGNAVESFLTELGVRMNVGLAGANGINAKLERFATNRSLPRKLLAVGKYLGNVRNAADHGVDTDIGAAWNIRISTGREYTFVAASFIANVGRHERGDPREI